MPDRFLDHSQQDDESTSWWPRLKLRATDRRLIVGLREEVRSLRAEVVLWQQRMETLLMAIRPEIQAILDKITPLTDALQKLEAHVNDEDNQITELKAKVDAGNKLSDDEVAALADAAGKLQSLATDAVAKSAPVVAAAASASTTG